MPSWGTRGMRPGRISRTRRFACRGSVTTCSGWTLVLLTAATSVATVLVRLLFPWDSHQVGEFQLWRWPQYLAMFGLGIVAGRRGWLDPVPDQIRCGRSDRDVGVPGPHRRDPRHRRSTRRRPRPACALGAAVARGDRRPAGRRRFGVDARRRTAAPQPPAGPSWPCSRAQRLWRPLPAGTGAIGLALALRPVDLPAEIKPSPSRPQV